MEMTRSFDQLRYEVITELAAIKRLLAKKDEEPA
jgi:hypothetical protein